jgi:endonuclease/exonuclease/phosphatase family metal-dependent hydrolase
LNSLFPSLSPEILCLQEVTLYYIDQLEQSDFFASGYSHTPVPEVLIDDHFPMIVSKLPFDLLYNQDHILICLFEKEGVNFIIANGHLNYLESNRDIRKSQIEKVRQLVDNAEGLTDNLGLKIRIQAALNNQNIFFMGDLNMHFPGENSVLEENSFFDLWLEQKSHFVGLTWDPVNNAMTHYKSMYDNRRMRLDRVCLSASKEIDLGDVQMVATDQIGKIVLYPSDHFGISASFCRSNEGFIPQPTVFKEEFKALPQDITGYRTQDEIDQLNKITYASLGVIGLLILIQIIRHLFR